MTFTGFPRGGAAFFAEIARNQDRDWFAANKVRYETLWVTPMEALLAELQRRMAKVYPSVAGAKPKVMRIYRDVRFSHDKSPFKTNIGAGFPLSRSAHAPGLYVHADAKQFFVAAGIWMMQPPQLSAFREAIASKRGVVFAKQVAAALRAGFEIHGHDRLKRVPAPYEQDHPRGELLKQKGFALGFPAVPVALPASGKLVDWIVEHARAVAPAMRWLDAALA